MLLFALPFAGVGIGMTGWAGWCAWQFRQMQSWVETPATILDVNLKRGDDTDQVTASYAYKVDGKEYLGDRVTLHSGGDNIGSFQRDAYRELENHRVRKRPFRCFVNPDDPHEAILYRDLRWEMMAFYTLFATLFGSAGVAFFTGTLIGLRDNPKPTVGPVSDDEPWRERSDWASGIVRDSGTSRMAGPVMAVIAGFWLIAITPLLSTFPELITSAKSNWVYLTLIYPVVGLLIAMGSGIHFTRRRRYGDSVLELATTPGVVGGQLAGVIRIPAKVDAPEGFLLKLNCIENFSGSEDKSDKLLWQDERLVASTLDGDAGETTVPILLAIPFECEETSREDSSRSIQWKLEVSAKTPGVDYRSQFEVPIFKTPESQPDFRLDEKLLDEFSRDPEPNRLLADAGILLEHTSGRGIRLIFSAARNRGTAIGLTIFTAIWFLSVWLPWRFGAPILFPIIFGLCWLLLLYATLDAWLARSMVEVAPDGIVARSGWFGLGRLRRFTASEIDRFEFQDRLTNNNTQQVYRDLKVVLNNGKKRTLAKSIGSKMVERAILTQLNAALGRA